MTICNEEQREPCMVIFVIPVAIKKGVSIVFFLVYFVVSYGVNRSEKERAC